MNSGRQAGMCLVTVRTQVTTSSQDVAQAQACRSGLAADARARERHGDLCVLCTCFSKVTKPLLRRI